MTKLEHI